MYVVPRTRIMRLTTRQIRVNKRLLITMSKLDNLSHQPRTVSVLQRIMALRAYRARLFAIDAKLQDMIVIEETTAGY